MNKQLGRVLNLDTGHMLCASMLLVAQIWDPGPSTSPHSPTIGEGRFRPRDP